MDCNSERLSAIHGHRNYSAGIENRPPFYSLTAETGDHREEGFLKNRRAARVLVVDDEPDIQQMLRSLLRAEAYSVSTASCGRDALQLLQEGPVDLVLADIRMPGMDGLELLRRIKEIDESIEVIILTGYGTVESAVTAFKQGDAFDFIRKPLDDVDLLSIAVKRALERRCLRRKNRRMLAEFKKISSAIENSPNMMVITDPHGRIEYANPKYLAVKGYSPEESRGRIPAILRKDMHDPMTYKKLRERIGSGREWRGEFLNHKRSGEFYWERVSLSSIKDEEGRITHFVMGSEDITEQKRTQDALDISEAFNAAILNAIPYPILVLDQNGDVIRSNNAWQDLFRVKTGTPASEADPVNYTRCCREELEKKEVKSADHIDGTLQGIEEVIRGTSARFEVQIPCEVKGEARWYLLQVSRLDLNARQTRQTLVCQIDITLLKQMEDRLVHQRKMEAVATLAGGIAHEYNNALSSVVGNADLIGLKVGEKADIKKHLSGIQSAAVRMRNLSDRLLSHVKSGHKGFQPAPIREWLPEFVKTWGRDLPDTIGIELENDAPDAALNADMLQLRIVLSEVMKNAAEAIQGKGEIRVRVQRAAAPEQVCITVEDNGSGMDETTKSRIFEPFFTTGFIGRGVGMAVVYGIVNSYNGRIAVHSEPGKGTRVEISLPAAFSSHCPERAAP